MSMPATTEAITIRSDRDLVNELDALAAATDRSRNDIINQALRDYLDAYTWQIARIEQGIAAASAGQIRPADEVFAGIAARHGWDR